MANDEIKKALNCCKNQCCSYCPHWCEKGCRYQTLSDALDLITEQEKEIEFQVQDRARLQREIDELEQAHEQRVEEIEQLKAENKQRGVDYDILYTRCTKRLKQAKIDVLTELKEKYGMYYLGAYCVKYRMLSDVLNPMIEELKK